MQGLTACRLCHTLNMQLVGTLAFLPWLWQAPIQRISKGYLGVDVVITSAHASEVGRQGSGALLLATAQRSAPLAGAIRILHNQPAGLANSALSYKNL